MMREPNTAVLAPKAKPTPHPIIAAYIAAIEQPVGPAPSTSHITLFHLQQNHGQEAVYNLISDYFSEVRAWRANHG
jgi:hypothetical protein